MSGRPIRFLGIATVGWITVRTAMLWPTAGPAVIPRVLLPAARAEDAVPPHEPMPTPVAYALATPWQPQAISAVVRRSIDTRTAAAVPAARTVSMPTLRPIVAIRAAAPAQTILAPPQVVRAAVDALRPSRWSASAWFALRDGRGIAPGLSGGQLSGSQAGLRVAYAVNKAHRVALVGRVATPLKGIGREASLGVEWQPTKLPVRLVAEYRLALDQGIGGPAAGLIAGTGPTPLALGFDLETYAQAGIVRRRRIEPFAEGAARLSRQIVSLAGTKIDLGLGGWGGVQRGVRRLDVGPSLGVRIPIAGKAIRASLDWRQRIAGNARPGSGPVLVVGSDF